MTCRLVHRLIWKCLCLAWCSLPASPQSAPPPAHVLNQVSQILALGQSDAVQARPARVEGVVTFSDPDWGILYVQDASGGIAVEKLPAPLVLRPGDVLSIEGITTVGPWSPLLTARSARFLRATPLPRPRWIRMFELNSGGAEGQWVELSGVVRSQEEVGHRLRLELASGLNQCRAWILEHGHYRNLQLPDSRIRLRGVAGTEFDGNHRFTGFQLYVSSITDLQVLSSPDLSAFERPVTRAREFQRPMPPAKGEHRLHVEGVVTMQWPGRFVFIQDATGGICLHTVSTPQLSPGDRVEAVGFRVLGSSTAQLDTAIVRSLGSGAPPRPRALPEGQGPDEHANYELLNLTGQLLTIRRVSHEQVSLSVHSAGRTWTCDLPGANLPPTILDLTPGSKLRLTGVVQLLESGRRRDREPALWLRSPADIELLSQPLSSGQLGLVWSAATLGSLALCGVPVVWMRRRNRRRLQLNLEESKRRLHDHMEERNRIGRDLHDNVLQSIYAVGLGLEDCKRLVQKSPDRAAERITVATDALNAVLRDVRQFIRGLETRTLTGSDLKTALTALAMTTGENSAKFEIHADPSAMHVLTPFQAAELLNVAKEAMSNSLRHANASRTRVALGVADDHVRLEIADDGIGFDPQTVSRSGNGLRNLQARAKDLGARCEIISSSGQGTRVVLDLPPLRCHDTLPAR